MNTTITTFNGDTITYTYDNNNRLILKTYPDSSTASFAYNPTGQRASILDPRGLTTYVYDFRDHLVQRTDPDGTVISYTYDAAGNRTSVTVPSGTTTYNFDALNRLLTVTDPDAGVITYIYDAVGNRTSVAYPNGTKAVYTYDTLNRLIKLQNRRSDDSIISSYAYTLGPSGNSIRVQENTGRIVDYTYDALYRLTQESITDPLLGNRIITYTYDPVGNRILKGDTVAGPTNYTYDGNDRLLTENGIIYTYDNNGNTISKTEGSDVTTYSYDYENRLIEAHTPAATVNYTYDADGIRVSKGVDGVVKNYLVDKNRNYAQVLEERDGGAGLIASYVYGDDLISMDRSGVVSFYHYDGNLSTRQITDTGENITDTYTYDAFGIILDRTGSTVNNYLYTGEQYDVNIRFYYLRARYYNQFIGRFTSRDRYEGNIYEPLSFHKYLYANSSPIIFIDPRGEFSIGLTGVMVTIAIMTVLLTIPGDIFIRKEAWPHTKKSWSASDVQGLRNFVKNNAHNYINRDIDCADLAITFLIEYASYKGLPIGLKGYYFENYNSDNTILKKDAFLKAAKDGLCASELFDKNTVEKGELPDAITIALPGDLMMARGTPSSFLQDLFGIYNLDVGHTRVFLEINSDGKVLYIAGDPGGVEMNIATPDGISKTTRSLRWWNNSVFR